jgi:hypothetical protein
VLASLRNSKIGRWDFDPNNIINDMHVNPEMRLALMKALRAAFEHGLHVRMANNDLGVFRTPEQSNAAKGQALKDNPIWPRPVASGGNSAHNYGLGVDLVVIDEKGTPIQPGWKDPVFTGKEARNWFSFYVKLKDYMRAQGFEWAVKSSTGSSISNDSGHFEYHPGLAGLFNVKNPKTGQLDIDPKSEVKKALDDAKAFGKGGSLDDWLPYLWYSLGACH